MGDTQLPDTDSLALRIETLHAFGQPVLDFVDSVHDGQAACGMALAMGGQVAAQDVTDSPLFLGTPTFKRGRGRAAEVYPIFWHEQFQWREGESNEDRGRPNEQRSRRH